MPDFALVEMPDELPSALLVERFDIRTSAGDKSFYCLQDFCSLLKVSTEAKYNGTIERVAKVLRATSTSPDADLLVLFKRALFAWPIADGDMHLKNLAMLMKVVPSDTKSQTSRFAPVYDVVITRVFAGLARDRMALKLNGKDDHLRRGDFMVLARTIGLKAHAAAAAIDKLCEDLQRAIGEVKLSISPTGMVEIPRL